MELALVHDEIGRGGADGGAIDHQAEVLRSRVLAALIETVRHRKRQADPVAIETGLNAILLLAAERVHLPILRFARGNPVYR
jgi:hypothetical protein